MGCWGWGGGGGGVPFLPIIIRLLSLACRCLHGLCINLALLSMMPSILWPICISVISWPVACLASAMKVASPGGVVCSASEGNA